MSDAVQDIYLPLMNSPRPRFPVRFGLTRALAVLAQSFFGLVAGTPIIHAATVILGDTSGNTRGTDSIDIQSARGLASRVASGESSFALGIDQTVSGNLSGAIGTLNTVSGSESYAFGSCNILSLYSDWGYAVGFANTVSEPFSFAFGGGNTISAGDSTVFGLGITNSIAYSTMIGPSDSAKVTILDSGNVGVGLGTTSPTEKLDVGGNIRLSGSIIKAGGGTVVLPTSGTLTLPAAGGSLITTSGTQTITGATTVQGTTILGGSSTATQLKVDGTTGEVGIGISSPAAKLQVAGNTILGVAGTATGVNSVTFRADSASANVDLFSLNFQRSNYSPTGTAASIVFGRESNANEGNISFRTNDNSSLAERLRITASGNLGIGTTSPGAKVSVIGSSSSQVGVHINNTSTAGYSALRLGTDSVTTAGTALHDFGSTYSGTGGAYNTDQTTLTSFRPNGLALQASQNSPIKFFTGGYLPATERMRIAGDGKIGIGTTSPSAALDVNGTVQIAGDVKVKNNAVIRISPAGDILMGGYTSGTNPGL